ncbi:MAG TPA: hypothetical protein VJW77_05075 [Terriglobia bacterium]|nr:hypothetical protein [Terriglobia bacterium]
MNRLVSRYAAIAVLGGIGIALAAAAQSRTSDLSEAQAVELIRLTNTTETDIFMRTHQYAPMDSLLDHKFMKGFGIQADQPGLTSATYRNYSLLVTLSPDYMHYVAELIPRQDSVATANEACATAVFSNEKGVIYTGRALGCDEAGGGTAGTNAPPK